MNIHVTIIEDEERFAQDLTEKIRNWFHAHHLEVAVKWYPSSHHIFFHQQLPCNRCIFPGYLVKRRKWCRYCKKTPGT